MAMYFEGFEYDKTGWDGSGAYTSPVDLLTWHTVQGGSLEGARATLHAKKAESTVLVEIRASMGRRRVQLVDGARAAKSLRNLPGGIQTNKNGTIQVEVVGWAEHPEWFTEEDWLWCGFNVAGPILKAQPGIPNVVALPFHPYPPENGIRLSREPWRIIPGEHKGHCGHQHWLENAHGDPGAWSAKLYRNGTTSAIDLIIEGANKYLGRPTTPIEEPLIMNEADEQKVRNIVRSEIRAAVNPDGKGNLLVRTRNSVALQERRSVEIVKGVRDLLDATARLVRAIPGNATTRAAVALEERGAKLVDRVGAPREDASEEAVVADPLDPPASDSTASDVDA